MSGPKKSSWEIKQEIIEQRKREKAIKRANQTTEINNRISDILSEVNYLTKQYPELIKNIQAKVNEWISEIRNNLNGDLRECFRGLKGVENYIKNQKSILKDKQKVLDAKKLIEAKKKMLVESLESVKDEYKDILNDAIIQRVEVFKKSILANPDNLNTQKQIADFKKQLFKMQEEYLEKKANTQYVAKTFANILDSNIENNGDGLKIKGSVEGVPITVKLNLKNNNIDMDTPVNGNCKQAIETMQKKLNNSNINLGEIKVVNSGEILNRRTNKQSQQRIKQ
jgi:hypothetical protein